MAKAAGGAAVSPLRRMAQSLGQRFESARQQHTSSGAPQPSPEAPPPAQGQPAWAQRLQQRQAIAHGATSLGHAAASGQAGGGASVDLSEE
ncbi:hypothetical protein E1H18_779 [Caulobacter sp. RHG1]|nr:hypothetical protein [Caulobacter sp. RHG1]